MSAAPIIVFILFVFIMLFLSLTGLVTDSDLTGVKIVSFEI